MGQGSDMQKAERLYEALTGEAAALTSDLAKLLASIGPDAPVLVELPWGELRNGETHARHQIILTRVSADRVYFINALKTPAKPGVTLGGPGKGPERRLEANGEESMALAQFRRLFERGGKAMLT